MTAEVHAPAAAASPAVVLFCVPGGGMNRRYFDLPGFSFADRMTRRGAVVVTLDYPGVGESSRPLDGFSLTAALLAECLAEAVAVVGERLRLGTAHPALPALPAFVSIGVGHSMGGMLTILQAHAHPVHDALVLLGFSTAGLPQYLGTVEREIIAQGDWRTRTPALGRARFGTAYVAVPRGPAVGEAGRALEAAADMVLATPAAHSMVPGNVAEEAAGLTSPVFLAVGERDLTGAPGDLPAMFRASASVTLHVLPGAGHHPFVAKSAAGFYDALGEWLDRERAPRAEGGKA